MPMTLDPFAEKLRADRAERALAVAEAKLARVLAIVDSWEQTFGDLGIKASVAAEAIRGSVVD